MLVHHDKMELECRSEKHLLINLIRCFKIALPKLIRKGNTDMTSNADFIKLKELYKAAEEDIMDISYFQCLLGKSFGKIPRADLDNK
jgi:hypothetical protein